MYKILIRENGHGSGALIQLTGAAIVNERWLRPILGAKGPFRTVAKPRPSLTALKHPPILHKPRPVRDAVVQLHRRRVGLVGQPVDA